MMASNPQDDLDAAFAHVTRPDATNEEMRAWLQARGNDVARLKTMGAIQWGLFDREGKRVTSLMWFEERDALEGAIALCTKQRQARYDDETGQWQVPPVSTVAGIHEAYGEE